MGLVAIAGGKPGTSSPDEAYDCKDRNSDPCSDHDDGIHYGCSIEVFFVQPINARGVHRTPVAVRTGRTPKA